jgi:hypothetical protein
LAEEIKICRAQRDVKTAKLAGHWWLTPVILATREAEIRRIEGQGQPGQIALQIPTPK